MENDSLFKPLNMITSEKGDEHESVNNITTDEINTNLKKTKNSAPGEDGISNAIIKMSPLSLKSKLCDIYNKCIQIGYFPSLWKKAVGIMLPKPDKDQTETTNYRPISLLSCLGKLLERILANRLKQKLIKDKAFNKWQRAYLENKEGMEHVLRLVETAQLAIKKNWLTGTVLLDVEKAFDSVWHDGLKYKLAHYNLPNKMIRILASFLDNRKIQVKIKDTMSESVNLKAGTPQGSVLSPLLFILYVNDLPVHPAHKVEVSQFADDLGLWTSAKNKKTLELRLNAAMEDLELWCSMWRIKLNAKKTQLVVFNKRKTRIKPNVTLFGEKIPQFDQATLLGITLDHKMSLNQHIANITKKARQRTGLLVRLRGTNWGTSSAVLIKLYKAFIRPILEYGAVIFAAMNKTNIKKLQRVQNRALRIALKMPFGTSIKLLQERANIEPIADRLSYLGKKTIQRYTGSQIMKELKLKHLLLKKENKPTTLDFYFK